MFGDKATSGMRLKNECIPKPCDYDCIEGYKLRLPRVKAIVDALKEFDITIHWFSLAHALRQYSARCRSHRMSHLN